MVRIQPRAAGVILLVAAACNHPAELPKRIRAIRIGPQIQVTALTIRTTLQPENKTTSSTIVIGPDGARDLSEVGTWRLFDTQQNRVAFVDDIGKVYRYESLQSLQRRRADAGRRSMSESIPRAEYSVTGIQRPILGVTATQSVVKLGAYQREIWIGSHPLIPPALFALMQASDSPTPGAPMAAKADEALLAANGFPLLDHAELPYGTSKIVVDREVVRIQRQNVPESLLQIPADYRDISQATLTKPGERPPGASSRPPGQRTPEGESQSSAKVRKDP